MPNIDWELSKFIGMHTQPSKVEGGEVYGSDMQNLRIDGDGWLRPRSEVLSLDPDGENITGIAASQDHVWILRSDGKLYVRANLDLSIETEITGVSDLEGRISVVGTFRDYVILTSEGDDQGWMVDLREDKNFQYVPLGIEPPPPGDSLAVSLVHELPDNVESVGFGELRQGTYIYTYAYLIHDRDDDLLPWNNMQSNLWDRRDRFVLVTPDEDTNYARVQISYSGNLLATHIRIYRAHVDAQPNYTHVADIPLTPETESGGGGIVFYDGYSDSDLDDANKERTFSKQHLVVNSITDTFHSSRLPSEVKQINEYNNLVFGAAGDRLVYSDLRNGNIIPWAFPEENEIRVEGRVDFCTELREVLLFGGIDGLHRLTGVTEYDFRVGNIGSIGPIDGYSWGKTADALAFVGEGGLYATDGSTALKLSDVVLDAFFNDKTLERGGVIFFKDNDILFNVSTDAEDVQFKMEDKYWTRWAFPFKQSVSILQNKNTRVLVVDDTGRLKQIDWNSTASSENVSWHWTSNFLDGADNYPKLEKTRKRFAEFTFTGSAENELTLKTWVDDDETEPIIHTFASRSDSLRPVRVPINRRGRRIKFQLSGTGDCKIQGIGLRIVA